MTFGEEHRDQRAPTRFERGVGVDVDFQPEFIVSAIKVAKGQL